MMLEMTDVDRGSDEEGLARAERVRASKRCGGVCAELQREVRNAMREAEVLRLMASTHTGAGRRIHKEKRGKATDGGC